MIDALLSPADRHDAAIPGIMFGEGALRLSNGDPEHAERHTPFSFALNHVGHTVSDGDFGDFTDEELATHTHSPSPADSQAPRGNDTYVNADEQGLTGLFVPVKFQLKSAEVNDFRRFSTLHGKSPPNRIRLIGAAA